MRPGRAWWRQQSVDRELLAVVPAPAPIELPDVPPRLVPELLDEPRVVLPGVDELVLPLGLDEAVLLLLGLDESVLLLVDAEGLVLLDVDAEGLVLLEVDGLVLDPRLPVVPADEPIVLAPPTEELPVLPALAVVSLLELGELLAELPRLRQGVVLPVLEAPMPLVLEPVLDPVLEPVSVVAPALVPVPVPEVEPLEEVCACTANEATASAALAARTASLGVLVMSEVLWLNHVRKVPARSGCLRSGVQQQVEGTRSMACPPGRVPPGVRQRACPATVP